MLPYAIAIHAITDGAIYAAFATAHIHLPPPHTLMIRFRYAELLFSDIIF